MAEFEFDDTIAEMEKKLRFYSPSVPSMRRDRMLYESGKAAASSRIRTRPLVIATLVFAVSTMMLSYSLVCSEKSNLRLKEELAKVRSDPELELMITVDEPVVRELPPTSYLALMRQADLYSSNPPMFESPQSRSSPEVSTTEPETNILSIRSKLEL